MTPPAARHAWSCAFACAGLASIALVAAVVMAPLLVYSLALATFGAAHVASELRYVDCRFGRRIGNARITLMAALLVLAAGARVLGLTGHAAPATAVTLELGSVALLALSAIARPYRRVTLALAVATALALATAAAPFDTAITLSILHNLTPLAFLYEIARPHLRRRTMALALVAFLGLPLLVATGMPRYLFESLGVGASTLDPIGAGLLAGHLHVYVPSPLLASAAAIDLFAASVVAQCAHYAAVIIVLPWLLARESPGATGIVPWPRLAMFSGLVAAGSLAVLAGFAVDFAGARRFYGVAASVHAWIEIPLIVIAVTSSAQPESSRPTPTDAPLAAVDATSA